MFRVRIDTGGGFDRIEVNASWFGVKDGLVQFYRAGWGENVWYAVPVERLIDIEDMEAVETEAVEAEPAGVS